MELKVKMRLNPKIELEAKFEGADLQEAIRAAGVLLDFDGKCGMCGSENISLQTRITKEKGYKFTEFTCKDCKATRPMGEYKDGKGFFLKDWQPPYQGNGGQK